MCDNCKPRTEPTTPAADVQEAYELLERKQSEGGNIVQVIAAVKVTLRAKLLGPRSPQDISEAGGEIGQGYNRANKDWRNRIEKVLG